MDGKQIANPDWYKLNDGKWHHIECVDGKWYFDGEAIRSTQQSEEDSK